MSNASVTPETKLAALNVLDSHLDSKVGPVFLSSAKLFHSVAESNEGEKGESLSRDFVLRLKPCLVRFMKPSSNPAVQDFQLQRLQFVLDLDKRTATLLGSCLKDFHIKSTKDSVALRAEKVKVMVHIVNSEKSVELAEYLLEQLRLQVNNQSVKVILDPKQFIRRNPIKIGVFGGVPRQQSSAYDSSFEQYPRDETGVDP